MVVVRRAFDCRHLLLSWLGGGFSTRGGDGEDGGVMIDDTVLQISYRLRPISSFQKSKRFSSNEKSRSYFEISSLLALIEATPLTRWRACRERAARHETSKTGIFKIRPR
jgi:hypothetical protein